MRYSGLAEILTPERLRVKWLKRIEEMHTKYIIKAPNKMSPCATNTP